MYHLSRFSLARAVPRAARSVTTSSPAPPSQPAALKLKSGQVFEGRSFGAPRSVFGETVFTTSITSYTESLTDPSYTGQILAFTQPLMGNYGVPDNRVPGSAREHPMDVDVGCFLESKGVQATGVVVSELCERFSHFQAYESLASWCARYNVPGIQGVDTRALTTLLRNQGSTLGAILVGEDRHRTIDPSEFIDPMAENLIDRVSTKTIYTLHPVGGAEAARAHIALSDFGSKANILRSLLRLGVSVTVLPWTADFNAIRDQFDGLFLSNGPGSPDSIPSAIESVRRTINEWDRPIFGICMGHQIIGRAAGLRAYRMKFGNRGHNQPVLALSSGGMRVEAGRVYITSQNHGYALAYEESGPDAWPKDWQPWFVNANDWSIEGIVRTGGLDTHAPVWGVQFHPEHAGGPEDTNPLFDDYVEQVVRYKEMRSGNAPFLAHTQASAVQAHL
ncbi:Multifunctional pyrimidine synthesis protein CAD [Malassezia pachydermatis]|uniref:Carbamoyl phosphate synthase arginine-specific small chain n=1 Tax=Malassezia pachydermatis TaxID=77020 RepID=A0A0M8MPJ4_9BASI|nr:carbamoyl-phosphate synthase [Malassezia pachydermatis]KOS15748.1 carbamoyl-phosphate synthase [Malassezia pachydermatis]